MNMLRQRRFSLTRHPRWIWAIPTFGVLMLALTWTGTWMFIQTHDAAAALSTQSSNDSTNSARSGPLLFDVQDVRQGYLVVAYIVSAAIAAFFGVITFLAIRLQRHRDVLKRQRSLLNELIDNVHTGVSVRQMTPGEAGRFVMWNESNALHTGLSREFVLGHTLRDVMPLQHALELEQLDRAMLDSPMVQELTQVHDQPGKGQRIFHLVRAPIFGSRGEVDYIMTNLADITEESKRIDALGLASKVFETTADGVIMCDADDRVLTVNRAFTRLTGYEAGEIVGQVMAESPFRPLDPEASSKRMAQMKRDGFITSEVARNHKNGTPLSLWLTASCVTNEAGEITNFVRVFTDISMLKSIQKKLEQLASYDPLTGLANRRLLLDRLEQSVLRARRAGVKTAVMFVDLDHLKKVNDTLGHAVGDLLLQEVAVRLHACIRASDSLGRMGGDEFAILLEDATSPADAAAIAQRIIADLSEPFDLEGHTVSIAASIGIAMSPEGGHDGSTLLRSADIAMYAAKQAGRNRYGFFRPSVEEAS